MVKDTDEMSQVFRNLFSTWCGAGMGFTKKDCENMVGAFAFSQDDYVERGMEK